MVASEKQFAHRLGTLIAIRELLGIGTLFYGFATVAEFFVSGQLSGVSRFAG